MEIIIQILIAMAFSAFFSGMEIAFVSSNKLRFEMDRNEQSLTSRILSIFYHNPNNFISTMLVGQEALKRLYMSGMDDLPNRVLWGSDAPTNNYPTDIVRKDIDIDEKIINDIADPRNVFDVPGFEPETYIGLWEKLKRSNADNFFKKK